MPSSAAQPVAPGRHGFPSEYVTYHQRARIFDVTATVVAKAGIANTPFEHIHQPTGVTKVTLYRLYPTRERLVVDAMSHGISFAVDRVCRAFDAAPDLDAALQAGVWALLDAAATDLAWTRFAMLEAVGIGPEAWRRRDEALTPVRERLRRLMPAGGPPTAPQWGVEAALAALRPHVLDGTLAATPALHRELVQIVSAMSGRPAPRARRRPAVRPRGDGPPALVRQVTDAFWAVDGDDGIEDLRATLDLAIARNHGPALAHAIRCLVARDDTRDPRFRGLRRPVVEALSGAWVFGTPSAHPGPRPYSLNSSRLRVLELLRELGSANLAVIQRGAGRDMSSCLRVLNDLKQAGLARADRAHRWTLTRHGWELLAGIAPAPRGVTTGNRARFSISRPRG
ncbi:MAG TPA: TetR/AcrR family transcriptional regulator [Baekduia sp.]|uniref:TetR/AcrR family transcriptional regulator n=1 Tax=Baekduia sp. TaxID=2600305 RepID=UPI002D7701F8|nr:TetR/AcrR family transcriptional regulator [Baekduia sp.]HET6509923.1 TetR/AcrR family transcriptional regulator [Baekduia sp.]